LHKGARFCDKNHQLFDHDFVTIIATSYIELIYTLMCRICNVMLSQNCLTQLWDHHALHIYGCVLSTKICNQAHLHGCELDSSTMMKLLALKYTWSVLDHLLRVLVSFFPSNKVMLQSMFP
jgi:hypothetical protein